VTIRSPRNFWGGVALVALAAFAFWASSDLHGMRDATFGPGTAPRLFAGLLAIAGAAIAAQGLLADGPAIEPYAVRGPSCVILAILAFAGMIRGLDATLLGIVVKAPALGLAPSAFFAFLISSMGSHERRWLERLIAAAVMTAFCVLLFAYLLGLPFKLWPSF